MMKKDSQDLRHLNQTWSLVLLRGGKYSELQPAGDARR